MKKTLALMLVLAMTLLLCGCGTTSAPKDTASEKVTLTLCAPWTSSKAIENVILAFNKKYPNVTIEYEYVQNFDSSVATRLSTAPETIDIFLTGSIQEGSAFLPYALDFYSDSKISLADTNPALIKNFTYKTTDTSAAPKIYSVPMGGEMRCLYVNKTLLQSVGITETPRNVTELLAACQTLKDAGYIPMQGNPGVFSQRLLYPYVCNLIANSADYEKTYAMVENCAQGVSELFREPMQLTYDLMSNYYYNYKYVESESNMFTDLSNEGFARDFLNIKKTDNGYEKVDDVGVVAFASGTLTMNTTIQKTKEDYHSTIEYECIPAPVSSEDGGYVYLSPGHGMAINKNSKNVAWAAEFANFFFSKEVNTTFAKEFNYIPNTADAFSEVAKTYDLPENHISDLGQCTFSYDFYTVITEPLISISKGNNPKYMQTDENGNKTLYPFEYYMEQLESAFAAQRESRAD